MQESISEISVNKHCLELMDPKIKIEVYDLMF